MRENWSSAGVRCTNDLDLYFLTWSFNHTRTKLRLRNKLDLYDSSTNGLMLVSVNISASCLYGKLVHQCKMSPLWGVAKSRKIY